MAQLTDIPNEILLQFVSHLPLKALIAARGINQHWRQLVHHAAIFPARRALLDLYLKILESPLFIPTRPWVLSRLQPFDREGYLDNLLKEHQYLPKEFCIWVLEWPARAAIRGSWPGLPVDGPPESIADNVNIIGGYNWLGTIPPQLSTMSFGRRPYGSVPALCLWVGNGEVTWLALDKRDSLRGKVYELYTDGYWLVTEECLDDLINVYADFIEWQKRLWEKVERRASFTWTKPYAANSRRLDPGLCSDRETLSYTVPPKPVLPWLYNQKTEQNLTTLTDI